jgi:translation initiation factor 1
LLLQVAGRSEPVLYRPLDELFFWAIIAGQSEKSSHREIGDFSPVEEATRLIRKHLTLYRIIFKTMSRSRLVYSTESGRICPECQKPTSECTCKKKPAKALPEDRQDSIIRIRREVKGRKGKTVTVVFGFQSGQADLKGLAKQLKQQCGAGGSVKDEVITIQGDHREKLVKLLREQGYKVKLAGG